MADAMRDYLEQRVRALEQRVVALEQAASPFAIAADRYDPVPGASINDNVELWQNGARIDFITVGDLRRAREALKNSKQ